MERRRWCKVWRYPSLLLSVTLLVPFHAGAWKSKAHVFLAYEAWKDATDDGKVTIMCGQTKVGDYTIDPKTYAALKNYPAQFFAGALGPDAYPDIATGQTLIHPATPGTHLWINYLWQRASSYNDARRAFGAGFLSHAAGDLFGHTFINDIVGGEFGYDQYGARHIVVESYIDKMLPTPVSYQNFSGWPTPGIAGVETFIYESMINATPSSSLNSALFNSSTSLFCVPAVYSKLRNAIQGFVDSYDAKVKDFDTRINNLKIRASNCAALDPSCSRTALNGEATALEGEKQAFIKLSAPLIRYATAWVADIEKGLKALPAVSDTVARAFMFGTMDQASSALNGFAINHLASMSGAPDWLAPLISAASQTLPPDVQAAMTEMAQDLANYTCKKTTGMTMSQLKEYVLTPEVKVSAVGLDINAIKGGRLRMTAGSQNIDWTKIPAMVNTVTMIKLSFLGKDTLNRLISDVGGGALRLTASNIMGGQWFQSLDKSNQWNANNDKMVLAQNTGVYNRLFVPESYGSSTVAPSAGGAGGGGGVMRYK